MDEIIILTEPITITFHDINDLTKEEKRRRTWRLSSKKYYQQNKEKIIKCVLAKYHSKIMDEIF